MGAIGKIINGEYVEFASGGNEKPSNIEPNKAIISDENGNIASSSVTAMELGYLGGLTGNIQEQINSIIENMPSGGGYALGDVKNLMAKSGSGGISLNWKDPDNIVFNGESVAEFGGTKVMRKEGGYSETPEDGVLVVDEIEKDTYKDGPLIDNNTTDGVTYFYTLFPRTKEGIITLSDNNKIMKEKTSYSPVLDENSWEDIIEAIKLGIHQDLWNIGDSKKLTIEGTTYWNGTYDVMIVDWDHYKRDINGTDKCNVVFMFKQVRNTNFRWADTAYKDSDYGQSNWFRLAKPDLEKAIPDIIKNNIVPVYVPCLGKSGGLLNYTGQTIFPNTIMEVVNGSSVNDGGSLLKYFENNDAIARIVGGDVARGYWCRSRNSSYAFYINDKGNSLSASVTYSGYSYRPLFCL